MEKGFKNRRKMYSIVYLMTGGLHIVQACVASLAGMVHLTRYIAITTIVYIALAILVNKLNNIKICFKICFFEIIVLSVIGTLTAGYDSGFTLYLLCIVPLTFYLTYQLDTNIRVSLIYASTEIILFFIVTGVSMHCDYLVSVDRIWVKCLYLINSVASVTILISFFIVFVQNINKNEVYLETENNKLKDVVNVDALTNLLNRHSFEYYFEQKMNNVSTKGKDFCMIMCDIDFFKRVNDTYGHNNGDEVLKFISNLIKGSFRANDQVFRWGGEEFLILLEANEENAIMVMDRCRQKIEESVIETPDGYKIKVTISIGITKYTPMSTSSAMVERADKALYESKHTGRNKITIG